MNGYQKTTVKKKTSARKKSTVKKHLINHDPFEGLDTDEQNTEATQQQNFDLGVCLTIEEAETQKKALMDMIVKGNSIRLDGENIEQVDAAGLQLLAVFFREINQRQLEISWSEVSKNLYEAVTLVGLKDALKMQDIEIQDDGEGTAWGLF